MKTLEDRLATLLEHEANELGDPAVVKRPPAKRKRPALAVAAGFLVVVGLGAPLIWLAAQGSSDGLITSKQILEDGVVTEAEYFAGADAVVECLRAAGIAASYRMADPGLGESEGHVVFESDEESTSFFSECQSEHLSDNVSLGWAATQGQVDLLMVREVETATFACVESIARQDFGELDYDEFNYLTASGRVARDLAFEYDEHGPWTSCYNDGNPSLLGLLPPRSVFRVFTEAAPPTFNEYEEAAHWAMSCVEALGGELALNGLDSDVTDVAVPVPGISASKVYVWAEADPGPNSPSSAWSTSLCRSLFFEDMQTLYLSSASDAEVQDWVDSLRGCLIDEEIPGAESMKVVDDYYDFTGQIPMHCYP